MTATCCIFYLLGLGLALRGEFSARRRLERMSRTLRRIPHA